MNKTDLKVSELYDLTKTLAGEYLATFEYPWEALSGIGDLIRKLGATLPEDEYEKRGEDVWVARSAKVAPTAFLGGPCIVGKEAEIRHCAFIRGKALIGQGAVVGNSTELKNVILFDQVQVPHYNYVGDSILGFHAHMGAGSITSNIKSDRSPVTVELREMMQTDSEKQEQVYLRIETGLIKMGAMLGDNVEVGCNSVLNPGTVVGKGAHIYPLSMVRGFVPAGHIYKNKNEIVEIQERQE